MFFPLTPVNWIDSGFIQIIILAFIWKNAGYNMVLFSAGLFSITLIYLAQTMFLAFLMSIINAFKAFKEIHMLAGAYPHQSIYMLQHYLNNQFNDLNYQKLSASSLILSFLCCLSYLPYSSSKSGLVEICHKEGHINHSKNLEYKSYMYCLLFMLPKGNDSHPPYFGYFWRSIAQHGNS